MEIALLLVIIVILALRLNTINDKLKYLQSGFEDIKDALDKLTKHQPQETIIKPITQYRDSVKEIIPEPIAAPIPVTPVEIKIPEVAAKKIESIPKPQLILEEEYVPETTWWERFREQNPDLEKFVGENIISKIGILILVLGISYFVKFAIDKNWINETARVGIGVLCGAIVMGIAHKLRANYKAFSSVLVAGAIAILYFTIAIAFHQYHIFGQTAAFILMVVITAFSVLISVSYDRMELAILSLIGGFAVPFMLSTGEGNYQVLFTYIAILDIGILAIAYMKRWSLVNTLAFAFTTVLYGSWLGTKVLDISQAPYIGAFLFATLFYVVFTFANIINNLRTSGLFTKAELMILVSNTFFYFSAGMLILANFHPELKGLFTISLALFNFICAWFLYKKFGLDKNAIYVLIGLTLTFVTLAIPLQFEGNHITLFWAAEAVLLLWLSQKSKIVHFRFISIIVHLLMIGSLIMDWAQIYTQNTATAAIVLNGAFVAGLFATITLITSSLLTKNETENHSLYGIELDAALYQNITKVLGVIVLYFTGVFEITYQGLQYFTGNYSPRSLTVVYHLVFSSVLIFFAKKTKKLAVNKFLIGLSVFNILFYIVFFSSIPLGELRDNIGLFSTHKIAFFLHYISLVGIIYQGFVVYKDGKTDDSLSMFHQKWFIWVATVTIVFVASNEVLVHGISFMTEPISSGKKDAILASQIYNKAQVFISKVAFPILWGILAFAFLTIGIKKQNRDLRIVALSLLAITIIKLFVYDISNVSETGKIIAFILLGVLILVMSFAYQKIRKIVLENEKPDESKNEEE